MIAQRIDRLKTVVNNFLFDPEKFGKQIRGGRPKNLDGRGCRAIKNKLAMHSVVPVNKKS